MQNTIQSTDLTFVAACLLFNKDIQVVTVTQDFRGIKVFHLSPASEVNKLQPLYARGEILLSPLLLANQIRQLKGWPVTSGGNYE
ncbi:MAG TPA: hypothetical protein VF185_04805 [Patescibacteria group bacterium]